MRLRLTLAYIGTRYCGWQIQAADRAMETIQGRLEHALGILAGEPVRVHGSGRTDAGVHAEGQVAHCDFPEARHARLKDMRHSLNALLPEDIRVLEVRPAAGDFHARFSAHAKTYRYQFWQERSFMPPRLVPFAWCCGPVDVTAMRAALPHLAGRHDFACFANAGTDTGGSTVRELHAMELLEEAPGPWPACPPLLTLHVTGSGFLKQMVRNMAGLLVDIGRGRIDPAAVPGFLALRERSGLPSATAPARGLTLVNVAYPGDAARG